MTSLIRSGSLPLVAVLALSGCEDGQLMSRSDEAAEGEAAVATVASSVTRDVEMPEVFSTQELALWDGRPSLGGVWVAHPDVTDPERVKITNVSSGKSIEGALFRRERDVPGPLIQVSSSAAAELELLAGQPTELALVVVREETIEVDVPAPAPLDLPAGEDAPISDLGETEIVAGDLSDNAAVEPVMIGGAAESRPRGFWGRLRDSFRNKPAEAASAADIAASADLGTGFPEVDAAPDVETSALDPVASAAAAAITEAETEAAARPGNSYVQVGLFGEQSNAEDAAAELRKNGIVPEIKSTTIGEKNYWRVVVGPVATADDRTELLNQVRNLGYSDAFFTSS